MSILNLFIKISKDETSQASKQPQPIAQVNAPVDVPTTGQKDD